VLDLRRPKTPPAGADPLLHRLDKVEAQLQEWIDSSPSHAEQFRRDPLGAIREAGLNMDDDIMLELELITKAIAKKLR
jgi:hypothetical protein